MATDTPEVVTRAAAETRVDAGDPGTQYPTPTNDLVKLVRVGMDLDELALHRFADDGGPVPAAAEFPRSRP